MRPESCGYPIHFSVWQGCSKQERGTVHQSHVGEAEMHEGSEKPQGSLTSLGGNESMKFLAYRDLRARPEI